VRRFLRLGPLFVLALASSVIVAATAANSVPGSRASLRTSTINAQALKPDQCAALTLTAIVRGTGSFSGTNAAELLLGGGAQDTIAGSGGNDCLVAGGGNDSMNGGTGTDVCFGGPGTDTFNGSCETQIQ
jgi:Ca2+-binding RTX toxin-like protein